MTILNNYNFFLFDLDGTLADSLPTMQTAYRKFAIQHNFTPNQAEFTSLNGPSLIEIVHILREKHNLPDDSNLLYERYIKIISESYTLESSLFCDTHTLMQTLKHAQKSVFIVTSSSKEIAFPFLYSKKMFQYLDGVVYGDEVLKSKPDSAPYLLALHRHNIPNHEACAFEDSINGVLSARGANITTFGVNNPDHASLLKAGADKVYTSITHILHDVYQ